MSKMKQPKISVIVPIYKVEKYLVQCIDSILNQTLEDIEVILVDEGDRDACRFIIDHYEQNDKRVKAIHEKNGGYGASVNKGMSANISVSSNPTTSSNQPCMRKCTIMPKSSTLTS